MNQDLSIMADAIIDFVLGRSQYGVNLLHIVSPFEGYFAVEHFLPSN